MEGLRAFHESQGRAFRPQKVSGHTLDPYKMFLMIVSRGGYSRVNKNSRWFVFGKPMGIDFPESKQQEVGFGIKNYYLSWLREYEKALDDEIKLTMATEFAANNPQLVPNPGLILSYYNSTLNPTHGTDEAPLTRSAAASLSRTRSGQSEKPPLLSQKNKIPSFSESQLIDSAEGFYIVPCQADCIHSRPKPPSNISPFDLDQPYIPKYPVTDDVWYLMAHFKSPDTKLEEIVHIINNLVAIAANKRLFLSSFPSILNDFSQVLTLCTFSIDSALSIGERSYGNSLDIPKLRTIISKRVSFLNISRVQRHLLASSSSLISHILSSEENLDFLLDLNTSPNISGSFPSISAPNRSFKTAQSNSLSSESSSIPTNTLKSSYLKTQENDELLEELKTHFTKTRHRNKDNEVINIKALLTSLLTVFRTSSNIIFFYERLLHWELLPLISEYKEKISDTNRILLKMDPKSTQFKMFPSQPKLKIERYENNENSFQGEISLESLFRAPENKEETENPKQSEEFIQDEEIKKLTDWVPKYLNSDTRIIWVTLSSTITSLNQLIPVFIETKLAEVLILFNSFLLQLFEVCEDSCQFSLPSLSNCAKRIKGKSGLFALPCLIYNREGIQFLSEILEFACNIILNISSASSNKVSRCDQRLLSSFFQATLKLSSVCLGFLSFLEDKDPIKEKLLYLNENSVKVAFRELVLPVSLATLTAISEHISFGKIFQSFSNLHYHFLHHHTQFTQSLIESQPSNQINQEILKISDSNDSFVKDQVLILWGREVIGPVFQLLKSELNSFAESDLDQTPPSCLMLSQFIIYISSELMSWNSRRDPEFLQYLYSKPSREVAIGILTPFVDTLIELAWIPSTFRNIFWSIISELSDSGVSNSCVTFGLTRFSLKHLSGPSGINS
ncbi:ARID/BRIGHT DNA binding domain-containing protein [Cryptosporidium felis]|nr:ARID/BRIGHT DNA binding domain-containing protein [Cryptosporidium felis]